MKLSTATLDQLAEVIAGENGFSPYRSGSKLVKFFNRFGENDVYGQGFGSRVPYTRNKLDKFNNSKTMEQIVCAAFDFWNASEYRPSDAAKNFDPYLARNGYQLVLKHKYRTLDEKKQPTLKAPYYVVVPLNPNVFVEGCIKELKHWEVVEHVEKAQSRIEMGDYAGAISSAYTLVEVLLKRMLNETKTEFKETTGDLDKLYKPLKTALNLDPASDSIEATLKPILVGLEKLVAGTKLFANKAGDRHAKIYNPARHHAILVVNSAYVLCEFLVETYEYQQKRGTLNTGSVNA